MRATVISGVALLLSAALSLAAEQTPPNPGAPKVSVEPVAKTNTTLTGEPINVPVHPNVVVGIATFPPGAALPVHKHPYPHYVYVLEGDLTVTNVETGKVSTVKQGSFFVETNTAWHLGKNDGTTPLKLLTVDQLPDGVTSNMQTAPPK